MIVRFSNDIDWVLSHLLAKHETELNGVWSRLPIVYSFFARMFSKFFYGIIFTHHLIPPPRSSLRDLVGFLRAARSLPVKIQSQVGAV